MPNENIPFLKEIQKGYLPNAKNAESANAVFDLVADEAKSVMEMGEQAEVVSSAARQAINEVLKGEQVWTTVLESVQKKLMDGVGNMDSLRELRALQVFVKENLPILSQGRLEKSGTGEGARRERAEIVLEVQNMVVSSVAEKLADTKHLPPRITFVQSWQTAIPDLKRRLGVAGKTELSKEIDNLLDASTPSGNDALLQVNRMFSEAKITEFVARYEVKSEADSESATTMSPQGEVYAAFLQQQLESFDAGQHQIINTQVTQLEEQFLNDIFAGIWQRNGKLSKTLDELPDDRRGNRAISEIVKMSVEGGNLGDYLLALGQLSNEQRRIAFQNSYDAWNKVPRTAEEKSEAAKILLVAFDRETDGETNYAVEQLQKSAGNPDVVQLRAESKAELTKEAMGELTSDLFTIDLTNPSYRLYVPELVSKLIDKGVDTRRLAAAQLAKQEIFQTTITDILEKHMPKDVTQAQQFIDESRFALKNAQKLEYYRQGKDGFVIRKDLGERDNQVLERRKQQMFLVGFVRHLLNQPQHAPEAVTDMRQYFADAEKFGVTAKILIDIHNSVSTAIVAFNKKIEATSVGAYHRESAAIDFTDHMTRVMKIPPPLGVHMLTMTEAKGLENYGWGGEDRPSTGNVGIYTDNAEDSRDQVIAGYAVKDVLKRAQMKVDKSGIVPLLNTGAELDSFESRLARHESLLKPGFGGMYEGQQWHNVDRFDNLIKNDPYVDLQTKAAESLVEPDEQALKAAMEKLALTGKKGDELSSAVDSWGYHCENDYSRLGFAEKGLIRLGGGSSTLASEKHRYEQSAEQLTGEKFNLLESADRLRLRNTLEARKKAAQKKLATEIATKIKGISAKVVSGESMAAEYVKMMLKDPEMPSLEVVDYSQNYRTLKVIAADDINTVQTDPRLEVIYRTFQKAREAYGKRVYSKVNNLVANRAYGTETQAIEDAVGELRLKLGYTEARESMGYSREPSPPKVDLTPISRAIEPVLKKGYALNTQAINLNSIKSEPFKQMPGGSEDSEQVVLKKKQELEQRQQKLVMAATPSPQQSS